MILSSSDLWTSILCTADESATTSAKSLPTRPNTHSILFGFLICLSVTLLLLFVCPNLIGTRYVFLIDLGKILACLGEQTSRIDPVNCETTVLPPEEFGFNSDPIG